MMPPEPYMSTGSGAQDLRILTVCPLCRAAHPQLQAQVVAERDDAHLLFLECRQCGSAVVAIVTVGVSGLTSVGAVTDLTSAEVVDLPDRRTVVPDDVIDLYAWLARRSAWPFAVTPRIR